MWRDGKYLATAPAEAKMRMLRALHLMLVGAPSWRTTKTLGSHPSWDTT